MLNGIIKYNIDPVILLQIAYKTDSFEPVFIVKPYNGSSGIFHYMKVIYSENNDAILNLNHMDMSKIKVKRDEILYTPTVFSTMSPISLVNVNTLPLNDNNSYIIQNSNIATYSKSYFLVIDLFKQLLATNIVDTIDHEFNLYDIDHNRIDTSAFLYENDVSEKFQDTFIQQTSPSRLFPIDYDEEFTSDSYIDEITKEMLLKLNSAALNIDYKNYIIIKNVEIIQDKEIIANILNELSIHGTTTIETKLFGKILLFHDLLKQKYDYIGITVKDTVDNRIDYRYVGLLLKTKEYLSYVFYKYFIGENVG
jgi:hypothetical protein